MAAVSENSSHRKVLDGLVADIRQQAKMTGALDRNGQLALMTRTGAGHTAGNDLCTFAEVSSQTRDILIIDRAELIDAERAYFFSAFSAAGAGTSVFSLESHNHKPPYTVSSVCREKRGGEYAVN